MFTSVKFSKKKFSLFTSQGTTHINAWNWRDAASVFKNSKLHRDEKPTKMGQV